MRGKSAHVSLDLKVEDFIAIVKNTPKLYIKLDPCYNVKFYFEVLLLGFIIVCYFIIRIYYRMLLLHVQKKK